MFHADIGWIQIELQKLQEVFSTQLNLNINLYVLLFNKQLGTSELCSVKFLLSVATMT